MADQVTPFVLIVEDNKDLRSLIETVFKFHGYDVVSAYSFATTIAALHEQPNRPFFAFVDLHLGSDRRHREGTMVLRHIYNAEYHRGVAYAWTGMFTPEIHDEALEAGAVAVLPKPIDPSILVSYVKKSKTLSRRMEDTFDKLTGLLNYDTFREYALREIKEAIHSRRPTDRRLSHFSLLLLDMNNFKPINDKYSHDVGDLALLAVAEVLKERLRFGDTVCRQHGDEFLIMLRRTSLSTALAIGEDIKKKVEALDFRTPCETQIPLSLSVGAAELKDDLLVEGAEAAAIFTSLTTEADVGPHGLQIDKNGKGR